MDLHHLLNPNSESVSEEKKLDHQPSSLPPDSHLQSKGLDSGHSDMKTVDVVAAKEKENMTPINTASLGSLSHPTPSFPVKQPYPVDPLLSVNPRMNQPYHDGKYQGNITSLVSGPFLASELSLYQLSPLQAIFFKTGPLLLRLGLRFSISSTCKVPIVM